MQKAREGLTFVKDWLPLKKFKLNVYGKRQTSDSSWEFLKIENEQIKAAQNNSYG